MVARFAHALVEHDQPDVSDIEATYLGVVTALRESVGVWERRAPLISAAIDRLEEAIREGQREGTVFQSVKPRTTAQLLVLCAVGLIAWADAGITVDTQELARSLLALIERRDKTR